MELTNNISQIAGIIADDWKNVNYAARPYLQAMFSLISINDMYMYDSANSIVRRFLCNAGSWRGPVAKQVKIHLKTIAGI
jgi:hypothetical protein